MTEMMMLDLDRLDLAELVYALDDHSDEHWWWLDPATGEVHLYSEYIDNEELDSDDVGGIRIDPVPSRESYGDLEDFTSRVRDPRARELLERAIAGRGAFRRFKDTLFEFPELREAWFAFSDARMTRRAVHWLLDHGLVDAAQAGVVLERFSDPEPPELGGATDADQITREAAEQLRKLYGNRLREVIMFGSWARGDADDESDLDLLVVLTEMESAFAENRRMSDLLWDLTVRHGLAVSAVPVAVAEYDQAPTAFLRRVRTEGRAAA